MHDRGLSFFSLKIMVNENIQIQQFQYPWNLWELAGLSSHSMVSERKLPAFLMSIVYEVSCTFHYFLMCSRVVSEFEIMVHFKYLLRWSLSLCGDHNFCYTPLTSSSTCTIQKGEGIKLSKNEKSGKRISLYSVILDTVSAAGSNKNRKYFALESMQAGGAWNWISWHERSWQYWQRFWRAGAKLFCNISKLSIVNDEESW